jgi:hypothetical protein
MAVMASITRPMTVEEFREMPEDNGPSTTNSATECLSPWPAQSSNML